MRCVATGMYRYGERAALKAPLGADCRELVSNRRRRAHIASRQSLRRRAIRRFRIVFRWSVRWMRVSVWWMIWVAVYDRFTFDELHEVVVWHRWPSFRMRRIENCCPRRASHPEKDNKIRRRAGRWIWLANRARGETAVRPALCAVMAAAGYA